jgi:hypothetical protein
MIQENIFVVSMISKHPHGLQSHVNIQTCFAKPMNEMFVFFIAAKPLYDFYKELPAKMEVFRTKPTILECHVNDPEAPVKWFKNGIPIDVNFSCNVLHASENRVGKHQFTF